MLQPDNLRRKADRKTSGEGIIYRHGIVVAECMYLYTIFREEAAFRIHNSEASRTIIGAPRTELIVHAPKDVVLPGRVRLTLDMRDGFFLDFAILDGKPAVYGGRYRKTA